MARVATWLFLMIIYFVLISIMVGAMSAGGILTSSEQIETNPAINSWQPNTTASVTIPQSTSAWDLGDYLLDLFAFFTFGIDLGLGSWNWIVTLLFVYIPLIMFLLLIYYSLRSGSS